MWLRCDWLEFPPKGQRVWIWDGSKVHKGTWTHAGVGAPVKESGWQDLEGLPINASHWMPEEESAEVPAPPPRDH